MRSKISKRPLLPALLFVFISLTSVLFGCRSNDTPGSLPEEYPADLAYAWINMQTKMFLGMPGLLPHVTGRIYGYTGLTMYESMVPGMPGYQSIAPQLNGDLKLPAPAEGKQYFWPASTNAALAFMLKSQLPHASLALLNAVDSLESYYHKQFQIDADVETLQRSADFGRQTATAIFEWSKTDGGYEAYKSPFSETYVPPAGPGKWVATGEFPFTQPVYPHWGDNRSFIPGSADATQPPPHPAYSEQPGSAFYDAVMEIYMMSQNLTREDSLTAKFWAYESLHAKKGQAAPVYNDASHAANIAMQMMIQKEFSLPEAAVLFCKHAVAANEAGISIVKAKFHYNLVRPITYIRNVLGHPEWMPVIPTPPFPEYTSGHAVASSASATVLEDAFGKNFPFTDRTFEDTYGPRSFDSFEAYATEAALSRLKGGIHYRFAMDEGLKQGRKVADMVVKLKFRK